MCSGTVVAADPPEWDDAVAHDRVQQIARLLEAPRDVDSPTRNGKTALMAAARRGDRALALRLLLAGASVNAVNKGGGTPLHYAAWYGDPEIVSLLIQHGAALDHQSNNGWTPLMMAGAKNHPEAAAVLLRHGADSNLADIYAWTPLMRAAYAGNSGVAMVLLSDPGTDPNLLNDRGQTALHLAVIAGKTEAVQGILSAGAKAEVSDMDGRTPVSIAATLGRDDIVAILGGASPGNESR